MNQNTWREKSYINCDFFVFAIIPLPVTVGHIDSLNRRVVMYLRIRNRPGPKLYECDATVRYAGRHGLHGAKRTTNTGKAQEHPPQRNVRVCRCTVLET